PVEQGESDEITERECRADAEVDAAGKHDDGHAQGQEDDLAELPRFVGQAADSEEMRNDGSEEGDDQDQEGKRYRVVGPVLRQYLADDVIGDEARSPS